MSLFLCTKCVHSKFHENREKCVAEIVRKADTHIMLTLLDEIPNAKVPPLGQLLSMINKYLKLTTRFFPTIYIIFVFIPAKKSISKQQLVYVKINIVLLWKPVQYLKVGDVNFNANATQVSAPGLIFIY